MKDKLKGVQQVVQELYDATGEVKASQLVEAAKPKDSPAHSAFEWNNAKAGEEYRLIQARKYIRRVEIIRDEQPIKLHHVPIARAPVVDDDEDDDKEGSYKPAEVIVSRPDEFQRALSEATAKLHAARRAVDALQRAAELIEDRDDRSVMVAQVAKVLGQLAETLDRVH